MTTNNLRGTMGRQRATTRASPVGTVAVGDTVFRQIIDPTLNSHGAVGGSKVTKRGQVVYIHPAGRYHVVEFQGTYGTFRESFSGVER